MYSERIDSYLEKNPFAKLSDVIADILQHDIITIKLSPGSKFNVNKIADDMNVSRTPVLEALSQLADTGFVVKSKTNSGYYVSKLDVKNLVNLYSARAAIEGEAAYCCAKYADNQIIKKLKEFTPGFEKTIITGDPAIKDYDLPFHRLIIDSSRNNFLVSCYDKIYPNIRRYQYYCSDFLKVDKNNPWNEEIKYQHAMIVSAIEAHNAIAAREAMQIHISTCINHAAYSHIGASPFDD